MIRWTSVNTREINRIGYNKEVNSLFVDFIGSDVDTVYVDVPESLYTLFVEAKDIDKFFKQFVNGYFKEANLIFESRVNSTYPYTI